MRSPFYGGCSEYFSSELEPGTIQRSTRHEDLQQTSFPSQSFDLIISSEVRGLGECGGLESESEAGDPSKCGCAGAGAGPHTVSVPGASRAVPHIEAWRFTCFHRALFAGEWVGHWKRPPTSKPAAVLKI